MASWREARRGKYSVGFKKRVVAEALVPGASVAEIARSHGLNANMIFGWRKDLRFQPPEKKRKAIEAALAGGGAQDAAVVAPTSEPAFLPVELAPEGAPSAKAEPVVVATPEPAVVGPRMECRETLELRDPPTPAGRIELVLANGHRLLLSGNVDADAVLRLARGLAAQGGPS